VTTLVHQGPLALFAAFVVVHVLADFPLQGNYLARQKTRGSSSSRSEWIVALLAHCIIQAGGVWLVSGSLVFGGIELVLHTFIDLVKGERKFGIISDQLLHLSCKLGYALWLTHSCGAA